jgi:hypothetical protein
MKVFEDRVLFENHKIKAHANNEINNNENVIKLKLTNIFLCNHSGCNLEFKTKKQLVTHHNKFEQECKKQKNSIIKLIANYKHTIEKIAKMNKSSKNEELVQQLKSSLKGFEKNHELMDQDYFNNTVG